MADNGTNEDMHTPAGGHNEVAVMHSPKYLHEYVWEYKLREHYNDKQKVPILGILVDRSERPAILPNIKAEDLPMAPEYEISEGELSDRLKTIDEITNRDILRAEDNFNKQILQSRCIRKDHQNIYVLIQELEIRLLQDALRGLSAIPEKEMLQDYQEYLDYRNAAIAVQLERNNYKYILMPKPAYRSVRDMLYTFARLGMVKHCTVMR